MRAARCAGTRSLLTLRCGLQPHLQHQHLSRLLAACMALSLYAAWNACIALLTRSAVMPWLLTIPQLPALQLGVGGHGGRRAVHGAVPAGGAGAKARGGP